MSNLDQFSRIEEKTDLESTKHFKSSVLSKSTNFERLLYQPAFKKTQSIYAIVLDISKSKYSASME